MRSRILQTRSSEYQDTQFHNLQHHDAFSCRKVPAAHYALKYNVMPYVGALTYGEAGRTLESLEFPAAE